jgi:hypothetical protein
MSKICVCHIIQYCLKEVSHLKDSRRSHNFVQLTESFLGSCGRHQKDDTGDGSKIK